jgi:hypothetical protein
MRPRTTIARATASVLLLFAGGRPGDALAPADVTIDAPSAAWTRQVEWGIDRFDEAGMDLPPASITVHDDRTPCDGNDGLFRHSNPGEPVEIHLCSPADVGSRPARLITLHELGHAWAETALTPEERASFLQLRGLRTWSDRAVPPHEWGAEHAAEVVSWGLMDELVPIVRIYDAEPAVLATAFEQLTGHTPLVHTPA